MLQVGAEEGGDVGARLGDDEVVHVEELGHAGKRGVPLVEVRGGGDVVLGLKSQGLRVRGGPGGYAAGLVFAEDSHWVVERVGGCVGGKRGGPDEDVGSGEVVEQVGHTAAAGGGDRDVEHAFGARVGFFEGELAHVGAHAFFQDVHVQEVAFADVADGAPEKGLQGSGTVRCDEILFVVVLSPWVGWICKSRKIDAIAIEEVQQFVLGVDAHQGCDQCSRRCSNDDTWQ